MVALEAVFDYLLWLVLWLWLEIGVFCIIGWAFPLLLMLPINTLFTELNHLQYFKIPPATIPALSYSITVSLHSIEELVFTHDKTGFTQIVFLINMRILSTLYTIALNQLVTDHRVVFLLLNQGVLFLCI